MEYVAGTLFFHFIPNIFFYFVLHWWCPFWFFFNSHLWAIGSLALLIMSLPIPMTNRKVLSHPSYYTTSIYFPLHSSNFFLYLVHVLIICSTQIHSVLCHGSRFHHVYYFSFTFVILYLLASTHSGRVKIPNDCFLRVIYMFLFWLCWRRNVDSSCYWRRSCPCLQSKRAYVSEYMKTHTVTQQMFIIQCNPSLWASCLVKWPSS